MAQTSASLEVPATADRVWQLIGGFNSLPDWLPLIPGSELSEGARVRHLKTADGQVIHGAEVFRRLASVKKRSSSSFTASAKRG